MSTSGDLRRRLEEAQARVAAARRQAHHDPGRDDETLTVDPKSRSLRATRDRLAKAVAGLEARRDTLHGGAAAPLAREAPPVAVPRWRRHHTLGFAFGVAGTIVLEALTHDASKPNPALFPVYALLFALSAAAFALFKWGWAR